MIKCIATLTDLFSGEFNYSWVKRIELIIGDDTSNRAIIRRVKSELGISGLKSTNSYDGDVLLRYFKSNGVGLEVTFDYVED